MRVLITGGAGLLGSELIRAAPDGVEAHATRHRTPVDGAPSHSVDLGNADAVMDVCARVRPRVVFHTAYSTSDPERNILRATENVARACRKAGAFLVHLSSDVVLDGERAPYDESAAPAPVHEYGRWKAAAERHLHDELPDAAIVRTSLIVRADPPDASSAGILAKLRRADPADPAKLFVDELRCPIAVEDLAAQLWEVAALPPARRVGIWHLVGPEAVSRYALGVLVALRHGVNPGGIVPALNRAFAEPRPRDLRLTTARADRELRARARPISEVLAAPA
ncbi:MAG TPA: SDR family oxidoreductase [Longimicrobium sp.]|nr:SDR family oxidoreductase [Longimicrobium sp.]